MWEKCIKKNTHIYIYIYIWRRPVCLVSCGRAVVDTQGISITVGFCLVLVLGLPVLGPQRADGLRQLPAQDGERRCPPIV